MTAPQPGRDGEVCIPLGDDAHARVSPDVPPELIGALGRLADAARQDFGSPEALPVCDVCGVSIGLAGCVCSPFPAEAQQCPDCRDGTCAGECGGRGAPGVLNVAQRQAEQRRSEPPALTQRISCGECSLIVPHFHARPPFRPAFDAPAEVQQDDERYDTPRADAVTAVYRLLVALPPDHAFRGSNAEQIVDAVAAALAARPSADTETLRRVREAVELLPPGPQQLMLAALRGPR